MFFNKCDIHQIVTSGHLEYEFALHINKKKKTDQQAEQILKLLISISVFIRES